MSNNYYMILKLTIVNTSSLYYYYLKRSLFTGLYKLSNLTNSQNRLSFKNNTPVMDQCNLPKTLEVLKYLEEGKFTDIMDNINKIENEIVKLYIQKESLIRNNLLNESREIIKNINLLTQNVNSEFYVFIKIDNELDLIYNDFFTSPEIKPIIERFFTVLNDKTPENFNTIYIDIIHLKLYTYLSLIFYYTNQPHFSFFIIEKALKIKNQKLILSRNKENTIEEIILKSSLTFALERLFLLWSFEIIRIPYYNNKIFKGTYRNYKNIISSNEHLNFYYKISQLDISIKNTKDFINAKKQIEQIYKEKNIKINEELSKNLISSINISEFLKQTNTSMAKLNHQFKLDYFSLNLISTVVKEYYHNTFMINLLSNIMNNFKNIEDLLLIKKKKIQDFEGNSIKTYLNSFDTNNIIDNYKICYHLFAKLIIQNNIKLAGLFLNKMIELNEKLMNNTDRISKDNECFNYQTFLISVANIEYHINNINLNQVSDISNAFNQYTLYNQSFFKNTQNLNMELNNYVKYILVSSGYSKLNKKKNI